MNSVAGKNIHEDSALARGIDLVGVGKKGGKSCSRELAEEIAGVLRRGRADAVAAGAFLGAIWMKGLSPEEEPLRIFSPESYFTELRGELADIYRKISGEQVLTPDEAYRLGRFLFADDEAMDSLRALFASALRVRHAEAPEYVGISRALRETFHPCWTREYRGHRPLVSLADPFDGVNRSHLITPLLCDQLNRRGLSCVVASGRSSGPKFGINLRDLGIALHERFVSDPDEAGDLPGPTTFYLDQEALSSPLVRWRSLRARLRKRPFLATIEKLVDPLGADILMASVFHGGFNEKMVDVAEGHGFSRIAVIFRAVEGTLGLSLARSARILVSRRLEDGTYRRVEMTMDPLDFGFKKESDPDVGVLSVSENRRLVETFRNQGHSGDSYFDRRVGI
ncbi:MAG: hypothetical protein HC902_14030 [Calothrix sp. SM1_5_4]|nr:hypothetical protein [Calothrix sp. SM1_5_4]